MRIRIKNNESVIVLSDDGNIRLYLPSNLPDDKCGESVATITAIAVLLKTQDKRLKKLVEKVLSKKEEHET